MLMAAGMGAHDGARHRVDHGLAAAGEGRRRLGGERHHPPGRRRARRRHHRQRAVVDLRRRRSATSSAARRSRAPPPPASRSRSAPRSAWPGSWRRPRPTLAASLTRAANYAFVDGMQIGVLVAAGATLLGAIIAFLWLPARARARRRRDAGRRARREPANGHDDRRQRPLPSRAAGRRSGARR